MAKQTKKQLAQELLLLEEKEEVVEDESINDTNEEVNEPIDTIDEAEKVQAPKKPKSEKQIQQFKNAMAIRDANNVKRKIANEKQALIDKAILEEKLVKKAIAIKKRQIKEQKILEIEDDEPVEKPKNKATPLPDTVAKNPLKLSVPPPVRYTFF